MAYDWPSTILEPAQEDNKDVDALFSKIDSDDGGSIEFEEMRSAFVKFKEATAAGYELSVSRKRRCARLVPNAMSHVIRHVR